MPASRKRKSRRPVYVKPRWRPNEEQRLDLRALLAEVDPCGREGDPAFLWLLHYWEACRVPWDAFPPVPAYHAKGEWLTGGVGPVLAAICKHVDG